MFTGIVEEIGTIKALQPFKDSLSLTIQTKNIAKKSNRGESIAVNGVCLTANLLEGDDFSSDVMLETFSKTNLKDLKVGSLVNLERALTPSSLMGGHIVQGHVDNVGKVYSIINAGQYWVIEIEAAAEIMKYLVNKASIAINGISLTLAEVTNSRFKVYIIPTTFLDTNISLLKKNDLVNLEVDMMGKYIYHYLNQKKSNLSEEFLHEHGF